MMVSVAVPSKPLVVPFVIEHRVLIVDGLPQCDVSVNVGMMEHAGRG